MFILTLRTDQPEAELELYDNRKQLTSLAWLAHRQLAETIHQQIRQLLEGQNKTLKDLQGIAVFQGPGSFTGLRIGISVANALANGLHIPIIGGGDEDWPATAIEDLLAGGTDKIVIPAYGSAPHITPPKH